MIARIPPRDLIPRVKAKIFADARQLFVGYSPQRLTREQREYAFSSGYWRQRTTSPKEVGRYSIIVGYCDVFGKKRILDVGCGQGVLAWRLRNLAYERYCGLDVSRAAVQEASSMPADERNDFRVEKAESFQTSDLFDLIVFNECLYYFEDPVGMVRRYHNFLEEAGHILISMYDSARSRAAWRLLDRALSTIDATRVSHVSGVSWTVKIMSKNITAEGLSSGFGP